MRIATVHSPDLHHFLDGIEGVYRKAGHEVRRFCPTTRDELVAALAWGEMAWAEFASEVAGACSYLGHPNLVVRMHSYEAYFGHVERVKWENVRTLVHTSEHVLELATRKAPAIQHVAKAFIPSGVDTEKFALQPHQHGTRIGVVARMTGIKQPGMWLQALASLRDSGTDYTLHIAGTDETGEWDIYLRHMAEAMGLADKVEFCGQVSDMAEWWRDKDYCLSTSAREGCPYNVIEAMACGVRPLVHAYWGADKQFDSCVLWNDASELPFIVASDRYSGHWFDARYSLAAQTPALLALLDAPKKFLRPMSSEVVIGGEAVDGRTAETPLDSSEPSRGETPRPSTNLCSLAMIALVRDQAEVEAMEKAVASVANVCDEFVIILDERSVQLIPWLPNMRIIRRKWTDSFSAARNYAAAMARCDWLLVLDADDHFETTGNLRESMEVAPPECQALVADCRNVNEHGATRDEEIQVVAYRRGKAYWDKRGHNQLTGYDKWAKTTAVLVSVYPSSRDREKAERTLPLLLKDFEDHPADTTTPFHIAKTYIALGDIANAKKYARITTDMDPTSVVFSGAWRILIFSTLDTEGLDACEKVVERAYVLHPKHPDILHARAFVQLARMNEAAADPANQYLATTLATLKYIQAIGKYGPEIGMPFVLNE